MSNPLVSVIIPFYAYDLFLREAVNSALNQTYKHVEVIVVDDSSPGASANQLLENYDASLVKVIRHQSNRGPSAARNTAVSQSRGDYILPLDADDLLDPRFIEKTLSAVESTEYGGAHTDIHVFGDVTRDHVCDCTIAGILNCRGGSSTFLYRKQVFTSIGGYKEDWNLGEDKYFWLDAYEKGWTFTRVPEPLLKYRKHGTSLSSGAKDGGADVIIKLFQEHKEFLIERIDDWLPAKEHFLWESQRLYQQIYAEWEQSCRNYEKLSSEYELKHKSLQDEIDHLRNSTLRQRTKAILRKIGVFG